MTAPSQIDARRQALEYFRTRGTRAPVVEIRERVSAAFATLDALLAGLTAEQARRPAVEGEWCVQEIVDHLVETHRPGVDELRCLLAGQRPPGGPIPASLRSKAPLLRPWPWLLGELGRVHRDILELLQAAPDDFQTDARAPLVMVVNAAGPDGAIAPLHWVEDLDWKAYAIVWRLHVVDHVNQARKVLGATRERAASAG
jgi:hypothetical protein